MRIRPTSKFAKQARKLTPNQQRAVSRALKLLAANPRDPRQRTHKLENTERWACGYSYDGRMVFRWDGDLITLIAVGRHDEVY